ncbi:glycosyltransferase family 2 protein [Paenibacillus eucommiae]|uniref:Cellulose synthase/poly-beta-1,6-N-acetylglucosamine synthase-like glycosyltransferase n=1 Tax=Paenibacillus eucommiae TaxID=1355755 RepID=A0ABS4J1C5_9BACL|nr:glycosyltransferase family 2 protein [Paenibacillus eucommiae]MBP1993598.1 cellulose synthase/poly-beta-1,6-N-acetylglucosamine synthase-like glycosyltransferase [Paenibacillus eucommiae]
MLDKIIIVLQVVLALVGAYQLFLSFFGWHRPKKKQAFTPQKSFAVLIAAHNEEQVVGALIENLKNLQYPKELYDIFVICDNCTDRTADIARSHAVYACERRNAKLRGKGYAIEWMLKELWKREKQYDAVVMIDADNLVSSDFLLQMNNDLCSGSKVIQAYLDTKNPGDSWITASNAISYFFSNRFWQMARSNLKLANFLGGTGMCFESTLLKEIGWGATSLVEDQEFSMRCVKMGIKPTFNYEARVYDEKPLTFKASAKQRLRWMQGHFEVARHYFFPLLWQGIKERSWVKIDAAIYSANVYNFFFGCILSILIWVKMITPGGSGEQGLYETYPVYFHTITIAIFALLPISMYMEKVPGKIYKYLILYPIYLLSWWPITVYAFFTQNNKQWSHTQHTRVIRLEEVQSKQVS